MYLIKSKDEIHLIISYDIFVRFNIKSICYVQIYFCFVFYLL